LKTDADDGIHLMSDMAHLVQKRIEEIYRSESRRVFATLVRLLRDFDLAEESLHEAFAHAVQSWTSDGIPENPRLVGINRTVQGDR
jgi:RNA polymerase sigma-70 factor (ECF subfamily)